MKKRHFYELSIIDDFGNGPREYFYTDEATIKKLAFARYELEKQSASRGERECYAYNDIPLYAWDDEKAMGYVIQHHGFTLNIKIEWQKVQLNKKRYKKTIYTLHERSFDGWIEEFHGAFAHVRDGMMVLKKLSDNYRQKYHLAYFDEDGHRIFNGSVFVASGRKKKGFMCTFSAWGKTSYEYDEWDIKTAFLQLIAQKVKFVQW